MILYFILGKKGLEFSRKRTPVSGGFQVEEIEILLMLIIRTVGTQTTNGMQHEDQKMDQIANWLFWTCLQFWLRLHVLSFTYASHSSSQCIKMLLSDI